MARTALSLLVLVSGLAMACGPQERGSGPAGEAAASPRPELARTLVVAMNVEPPYLNNRGLQGSVGRTTPPPLFDAGLTQSAGQGTPNELQLAEDFPQLNSDSWRVFPDGRMETTWRLRQGVKWHDDTSLVADDFVFAFQIYRLPEFDGARLAGGLITGVTAPDPRSVVIEWKAPYPQATTGALPPLPRHLLAAPFERLTSEGFLALPHWTTAFVGSGPYRLETWEPGAFIEGSAFADYVFGKPKIERVKIVWISDGNTLIANMLSEVVHYATTDALEFQQAVLLRKQWAATRAGAISLNPTKIRYVQIQHKTDYVSPAYVADLRVRQALSHTIDKQGLVDGMLDGEPGMADTFLSPLVDYYPELERILTKYPYNLRRAQQLMADAGFTLDAQGFYEQGSARLGMELAAFPGQGQQEGLILQDGWKRAGFEFAFRVFTPAQQTDLHLISTYPALRIEQTDASNPGVQHSTAGCATAERRWVGSNRGCFSDPDYDRYYGIYLTALDEGERNRGHIQAMKLISDKVGGMPLYYGYLVTGFTSSLAGPVYGLTNVHQWQFR